MQLSEEQLKEFKEAFSLFDAKGNGSISQQDLGIVMRSLGQSPTEKEVATMIKEVDVDGNGEIDFSEFVQMMKTQMKNRDMNKELMEAFQVFDCNRNGRISPTELKVTMRNLGQDLTDEQLRLMISEADFNGDGVIDFDEFKKLVTILENTPDAPPRMLKT
eukprot:Seg335.5 transcript_id=Seg335.5/GoldUCD/mRNA.D3Y31 product=Calmodulin protein_id=Seg335.5/GoldUCD/D3Y31